MIYIPRTTCIPIAFARQRRRQARGDNYRALQRDAGRCFHRCRLYERRSRCPPSNPATACICVAAWSPLQEALYSSRRCLCRRSPAGMYSEFFPPFPLFRSLPLIIEPSHSSSQALLKV